MAAITTSRCQDTMSRPSVFLASSSQQHGSTSQPAAARRVAAKRQELEGLLLLRDHSARLARDVEHLGGNVDALVEGGEAVAAVMTSWTGAFRAMQIARQSMLARAATHGDESDDTASASAQMPETLVRLPASGAVETTRATPSKAN